MNRFRVAVARWLLKGSGCVLVRRVEVEQVHELCGQLLKYAESSGALNDPRRLKARRRVGNLTEALGIHARQMEVGP